jgi:hypothetical protein
MKGTMLRIKSCGRVSMVRFEPICGCSGLRGRGVVALVARFVTRRWVMKEVVAVVGGLGLRLSSAFKV